MLDMAISVSETNRKIQLIADLVRHYGILIGPTNGDDYVPHLPCKPGLGMNTEARGFLSAARDIQQGLFKTLVMGKFKNGKSTFINAMLGVNLMAAKATATTSVIAVVQYGTHRDRVIIYRNDSVESETLSLAEFTDQYALNEEDQAQIEEKGLCDRFSEINHVEMESDNDLFKDGLQLIDSPGLEEANSRTKTTSQYVPKANAIIFLLNAASLFSAQERSYIAKNFARKGLRNIFFVVNRIDNLGPGQLEASVIPAVREGLRDVFLQSDGTVDEMLYDSRVFYTNAYGALCARTGEPYWLTLGNKKYRMDIGIEDTGMPEFEAALTDFLNSEERLKAMLQSTLVSMANTYYDASQLIEVEKTARALPLKTLEENIKRSEEILKANRADVERIRHIIQYQGQIIAKKVYMSLYTFVQTQIPREFAAAVENSDTKFGVKEMLRLSESALTANLPWKDPEEARATQERLLKPITDRINAYIYDQLEIWQERVPLEVEAEMRNLEAELDEGIHRFDLKLRQAVEAFSTDSVASYNANTANPLQTVIALSRGDVSLAIEGAAMGGMSWGDYFQKTILQAVLNWMIGALFGSAVLIPAMIVEIVGVFFSSQRLPKQLLNQIGPIAFKNLKERIESEETTLIENVQRQFFDQSEDIFKKGNGLIEDEERRQTRILEEKRTTDTENQSEFERQKSVLRYMKKIIATIYMELYHEEPSDEAMRIFATIRGG